MRLFQEWGSIRDEHIFKTDSGFQPEMIFHEIQAVWVLREFNIGVIIRKWPVEASYTDQPNSHHENFSRWTSKTVDEVDNNSG